MRLPRSWVITAESWFVRPVTEALVRVMVEGTNSEQVDTLAKRLPKSSSLLYNIKSQREWVWFAHPLSAF